MSSTDSTTSQETPDLFGAYPRLSEEQIDEVGARGKRRVTTEGEVLYKEGEPIRALIVILSGLVAVVEEVDDKERVIAIHGPRRFLGELNLLTGQPSFTTARVREPGEVLAVPLDELRELVNHDTALGDLLIRACLLRRSLLIGQGAGLRIIGSRYSADARRLREFAARNRIPHAWIDLEEDPEAETLLRKLGVSPDETPVVIWRGEEVLRNPTTAELGRMIGLRALADGPRDCDLLIVGAGPAGLAAAVYAASEGLETILLDSVATGGRAATTSQIENYLGFPAGISGTELADRALVQARKFGAQINVPAEATGLHSDDGHHMVELEDGTEVPCHALLIATGARYRKLPVPRLEEFEKTSVFYAATPMEARFCENVPVTIVGGGNAAGQAAIFVCERTSRATLIVRERSLTEYMSRYLADRIERDPRIEVMLHSEVRELLGDEVLEAVVVEDNATSERTEVPAKALFVFIGFEPHAEWVEGALELAEDGSIPTGSAVADWALPLETSQRGVFAAGDVRRGAVQRVAAAVGEGAMAVRLTHQRLDEALRH